MVVNVCDMIMGAGKTESAITRMREDTGSRYVFITPYLAEVERIKESCAERSFYDPKNFGCRKLDDLHDKLAHGCNIASTHALFHTYNDTTIRLLREGGYKLILDEVTKVYENLEASPQDIRLLRSNGVIEVDDGDGRVRWTDDAYDGKFNELRDTVRTGHVTLYQDCMMLWTFPIEVFEAFCEVTILTYLFDAQPQKYYFDINGVRVRKIGTTYERGEYRFCDVPVMPEYVKTLRDKIHVLDDRRLNAIGDADTALSVSWYDRAAKSRGKENIKQLKNNLTNVFKHRYASATSKNLWTTFKDYQDALKGKGYTSGFLSWNTRATNAYRERDHLAFCVNNYFNPVLGNFYRAHGVEVREDQWALGEMIQWIWRSAIRDGREIWIYVPSRRMRTLLTDWLDELAGDTEEVRACG